MQQINNNNIHCVREKDQNVFFVIYNSDDSDEIWYIISWTNLQGDVWKSELYHTSQGVQEEISMLILQNSRRLHADEHWCDNGI